MNECFEKHAAQILCLLFNRSYRTVHDLVILTCEPAGDLVCPLVVDQYFKIDLARFEVSKCHELYDRKPNAAPWLGFLLAVSSQSRLGASTLGGIAARYVLLLIQVRSIGDDARQSLSSRVIYMQRRFYAIHTWIVVRRPATRLVSLLRIEVDTGLHHRHYSRSSSDGGAMTIDIDLGSIQEVADLFSYPNNCHTVCFLNQTLDETIGIYLRASIARDGFSATTVVVKLTAGHVIASIDGDAAAAYSATLPRYLTAGKLALAGSKRLNADKRWRYNWRFFLPHGVAMTQHRSVQLLHFPPDYVLERDQDYLLAHTTTRWAALLAENGANAMETAAYQTIIDIAPIAAPSNDGANLEGIYDVYTTYINSLLELWIPAVGGGCRPLVAFGGPVRGWLKSEYGLDLKVLSLGALALKSGLKVPVLAANHPSFIYNAIKQLENDPNTPIDERIAIGMRVTQQDLVAARWQVRMSANPTGDPAKTLSACNLFWSDPAMRTRICELTYEQALGKAPEEAAQRCALVPAPAASIFSNGPSGSTDLDTKIERLREELGATESTEPPDIR